MLIKNISNANDSLSSSDSSELRAAGVAVGAAVVERTNVGFRAGSAVDGGGGRFRTCAGGVGREAESEVEICIAICSGLCCGEKVEMLRAMETALAKPES